jgi:uncharacterized protein
MRVEKNTLSKVFMDTLFVIALINKRDQYHEWAVKLSTTLEGQSILITDAVLLEIGNGLARGYKAKAVEIIEDFMGSDEVEMVRLNEDLFTRAFMLYKQHSDKAWGLVDCISFVAMRDAGIRQALTFDQHFIQAGFEIL